MRFLELMRVVGGVGWWWEEMRAAGDPEIGGVCEDSRKVRPGDLFVARSGTKENGAKYVEEAVARGAVAVVVESGQWSVVSGQIGEGGICAGEEWEFGGGDFGA